MKLIFIGPQGSGKGTQAKGIAKKLGFCHISTGDLLRETVGKFKEEIEFYMDKGKLVPDELIVGILKERLKNKDCEKGFILDGFPRTLEQVERLKKITNIDKVVEISISDEEAVRRICSRRGCKKCGAIYNINTSPKPSIKEICDKCGSKLFTRKDDNKEALEERLKVYHDETEKILKEYIFVRINGEQSIEKVGEDIARGLV
jgi:adenylate kinase